MLVAHAAVVLTEGDVEHPVQRVLDRPMPADSLAQDGRTVGTAREEVADLALDLGGRAVEAADALDCEHGAQARPAAQGFQGGSISAGEHPPADQAAMGIVEGVAVGTGGCVAAEAMIAAWLTHIPTEVADGVSFRAHEGDTGRRHARDQAP